MEDLRLTGQFDPTQATSAQSLVGQLPPRLQGEINGLREDTGLEPLQADPPEVDAVHRATLEMG